jgi:hypothetical protein
MEWRKENNVDGILSEDFSWWRQAYPFYMLEDNAGRPGKLSFRKLSVASDRCSYYPT